MILTSGVFSDIAKHTSTHKLAYNGGEGGNGAKQGGSLESPMILYFRMEGRNFYYYFFLNNSVLKTILWQHL